MLKDKVKIKVQSGAGGVGSQSVYANRAEGGNGGNGGSVYLQGSIHMYDLGIYDYNKTYKADSGSTGQTRKRRGADAKDLYLKLPLVTEVYVNGEQIGRIDNENEVVKVAQGGLGGYGNVDMKKLGIRVKENHARVVNEVVELDLVLKLQSDVIFIGFPNAGKSSLLKALTEKNVKIASYAFTTLDPQVGILDGLRLMDLPGLIEGTFEGKGVGTKFLKHTTNSRLVAHFISLEEASPMDAYVALREELERIDPQLLTREEIVILTKTDLLTEEQLAEFEKQFALEGIKCLSCSIIDDESILRIKNEFLKLKNNEPAIETAEQ